jgi:2-keto-4-pentenoate hydratase/2-oxohepta-3-ene-1,7-dioic acid hydratase in catechol pathway
MKLLNFLDAGQSRCLGLVEGERGYNLTQAAGGRAQFQSVGTLLRAGEGAMKEAQRLAKNLSSLASDALPLAKVRHAPLIEADARVFCVGLNYVDHAAENNLPPPESPIFFSKLAAVVVPHGVAVPLPPSSSQVDYEAEFAVVIGKEAFRIDETEAARCIGGYTIMNDVTARDFQVRDKQWFRSKNCEGFGPMGPWIVTADAIGDPGALDISLRLNGQTLQKSNTRNLIFPPARLISILSQTLALRPGDVISTGTPAGIGFHRKPQVFLKAGDKVEVEIADIGVLENTVVA